MWLSCASRLLSSRDRDITGHVDPGAGAILKAVRAAALTRPHPNSTRTASEH